MNINSTRRRSLLPILAFVTIATTQVIPVVTQAPRSSIAIAQSQPIQNSVVAVESVGMTVADMDRAIDFYTNILAFRKISDVEVLGSEYEQLQGIFGVRLRIVKLQLGNELIELTEYLTPKGKPIPVDSRSNDRWFQHIAIVVSDMDQAYQHLRKHKVQHASTAPQRIPDSNKAAAGIRAFYFKDPDGHNLEVIYFPPGKGNPQWQKPSQNLFLGIDHTAIVVGKTEQSLVFYRDLLGLKLAGESRNYGSEQAHLNQVEGAHLRISGLRATTGPGIEFLEYLAPQDGRSLPNDARPNDLLHWQTTLVVKDLQAIVQHLQHHQTAFVSRGVAKLSNQSLGFKQGVLVRDPDGHALRLVEK
jgi:catechol 2,3-dioxygenase-like lactoylglutathione lyase family enzyme